MAEQRINFVTMLWDANDSSESFSSMYTEEWVERLYRGFERNTSYDFDFICYTDRRREFTAPIFQRKIKAEPPTYAAFIEPFALDQPTILVGLDTIVVGNIDPLVEYCFGEGPVALPLDPYKPTRVCNGVALIPAGCRYIADKHDGETNDMEHLRAMPHDTIDRLFPGLVSSYKVHVKPRGLDNDRIVYFHGKEKPHELLGYVGWIDDHWR